MIYTPELAGPKWELTLEADISIAVTAAMSRCPFFEWIVDEFLRSGSTMGNQKLAIEFKCSMDDPSDVYSAKVLVVDGTYSWPVGEFDVLADFSKSPHLSVLSYADHVTKMIPLPQAPMKD
jgi:hypothetical protein